MNIGKSVLGVMNFIEEIHNDDARKWDTLKGILTGMSRAVEQRNGADSTVDDSSPINKQITDESGGVTFQMICTCPSCKASGLLELFDPRPEPTTKQAES